MVYDASSREGDAGDECMALLLGVCEIVRGFEAPGVEQFKRRSDVQEFERRLCNVKELGTTQLQSRTTARPRR